MSNRLDIYTDGSHLKHTTGRLGIGGILVKLGNFGHGMVIDKFSTELEPSYMLNVFGASSPSNPSAELVAVLHAIRNFERYLSLADEIVVHADYIGVREWLTGKWQSKEPYIKEIISAIRKQVSLQKLDRKIRYEWVRGHQSDNSDDTYWNNKVDLLAKGEGCVE